MTALFILLFVLLSQTTYAQGQVQYVYDDLGRLVAVVDPSGDSATYVYDAVGNLTAITRSSAPVKVLSFSPQSGPVGTTVTIRGTGFSSVAGNNTVTFNGTSATVISATANELVTMVPAAASTGPIAVTSPSGSATSGVAFAVTTSGTPSITGFTPSIGLAGTAVTVDGSNFDAALTNNKLLFNTMFASLTAATSTSLSAPVPAGATSGRLTIKTPMGNAASSSDFFVPPSPFTPSDVETTARIAFGEATPVTIGTAGKIALILFDGAKNQRVSLRITNSTITVTAVSIRNPDGSLLDTITAGSSGFLDTQTLPATGTYTIVLDPTNTNTGSMTLTLYDVPADVTGTITAGGSTVTVTTTTAGQNASLTFSGTSGQRVSAQFTNVSVVSYVSIRKPDGTNLVGATFAGTAGVFIDTLTLPTAGTYTIAIDPSSTNTGSMTVRLYDVADDVSGSVDIGGSPATITTTGPGQNAALTFSGTSGQRVSAQFTNVSVVSYVSIRKPDGTNLVGPTFVGTTGTFIDTLTLPTAGTYTIVIDPSSTNTGSMTVTLHDVPADPSGTIAIGGSPVTITTTTPGQNASLTFSGSSGQRVSVQFTNVSVVSNITIRKPDGTNLVGTTFVGTVGKFIDTLTLPAAGTYTIAIDPSGTDTGSMTVTLYDVPPDVTASVSVGGAAAPITITTPGQNASVTFTGTQNQQVTVRITSNTVGLTAVTLKKPDGTTQTSTSSSSNAFNLATQTLSVGGTYTIVVDPNAANSGSLNVAVTSP